MRCFLFFFFLSILELPMAGNLFSVVAFCFTQACRFALCDSNLKIREYPSCYSNIFKKEKRLMHTMKICVLVHEITVMEALNGQHPPTHPNPIHVMSGTDSTSGTNMADIMAAVNWPCVYPKVVGQVEARIHRGDRKGRHLCQQFCTHYPLYPLKAFISSLFRPSSNRPQDSDKHTHTPSFFL